jgi:hypothetical protein
MFVHYYTHVPVSLSAVAAKVDEVRTQLEDIGDVAYREGEDLFARVGPPGAGYAKKVSLVISTPEIRTAGIVYPVTWTASGAESLFPRLVADLVLSHIGSDRTKLSLQGTYDPPFGPLGRAVDRALLHKVAESTVQDWVDRVAAAVTCVSATS